MTRRDPVSILLLLLLAACVFGAGFVVLSPAKSTAAVSEMVEEALGECLEELPEGASPATPEFQVCEQVVLPSGEHIGAWLQPLGVRRDTSALCSFGWRLPLRI